MYRTILTEAGYKEWSKPTMGIQCWIKADSPDINVDTSTGLWAAEDANDETGFGINEKGLKEYLNVKN